MWAAFYGCRHGIRRPRRSHPAPHPRPARRGGATGGGAGGPARDLAARRLEAPARVARGGVRERSDRRAAPDLRRACRAACRGRCVADAVPPAVGRAVGRTGTTPRFRGGGNMSDLGTLEMRDGETYLRFERRLSHPVDKVWDALTNPD